MMNVFIGVMKSDCYIHDANIFDLEELNETNTGEELAQFVNLLLCSCPYSVSSRSELENISHDVFARNDMDDFCDMT